MAILLSASAEHFIFGAASIGHAFQHAAALGLHGLRWTLPAHADQVEAPSAEYLAELAAAVSASGVAVSAIHIPWPEVATGAAVPPSRHDAWESRVAGAIELCASLGTRLVVTASRDSQPSGELQQDRHESSSADMLDRLLRLRFAALYRGACLALDPRGSGLLGSPTEARRFIDEVNSPHVGLVVDLMDAPSVSPVEDTLLSLGHRVAWLTLSIDTLACMIPLAQHAAAPDAMSVLRSRFSVLRKLRYDGYLHVESSAPLQASRHLLDTLISLVGDHSVAT